MPEELPRPDVRLTSSAATWIQPFPLAALAVLLVDRKSGREIGEFRPSDASGPDRFVISPESDLYTGERYA
jgi:hypothetical protein